MRVLITAGPTREYLDDVRYLSNSSSGRMGYAVANALLEAGHQIALVSGPVELEPPDGCEFFQVETTSEMRNTCVELFPQCDGVIAAAAVCDYKPKERIQGKLAKTGDGISIEMIETDDVLAELGANKGHRWVVGFALEAINPRENALQKLRAKNCDVVVLNAPTAIGSENNEVELIAPDGNAIQNWMGSKTKVATELVQWIVDHFENT